MAQGRIELRSGAWRWVAGMEIGGVRSVRLRSENGGGEMELRVDGDAELTDVAVRELGSRAEVRRFVDGDGKTWTAEVRYAQSGTGWPPDPMVLFWTTDRACMATLRPKRPLGEMTTDELRAHLKMCLEG